MTLARRRVCLLDLSTSQSLYSAFTHNMASFFDIKARKAAAAAAATGEGSSKAAGPKVDTRLQPWVEK